MEKSGLQKQNVCSIMDMQSPLEIYIHIPFCVRKCLYCDFLSFPADAALRKAYTEALLEEIRSFAGNCRTDRISSVFLGGGTPTVLQPDMICRIMDCLRGSFGIQPAALEEDRTRPPADGQTEPPAEVTIEANPGTVTEEMLRSFRKAGINRLSLGCQSFLDRELRALGRIHSASQISYSFSYARAAGFSNISLDLMSGIPGQTTESWEYSLRSAAELGPAHISAYSLILEEGTPLFAQYAGEGAKPSEPLPDEDTERRMYEMTEEILAEYGYHRYEISNYALPGYESVHNTGYWTGVPYVGFGLGASSLLGSRRMKNTDDLTAYLENPAGSRFVEEELTEDDRMAEFMILGLRMTRGVSEEEFRSRFGRQTDERYGAVIRKHMRSGLLERAGDRIRLSRRGISLANVVMADFLPE